MNYEELLELVKARRSIRSFKPDMVSDEDIKKILEVARWAPSGMNFQPWEFIVVKDPDTKKEIFESVFQRPPGRMPEKMKPGSGGMLMRGMSGPNAPVLIVVCGDTRKKIILPGQDYELVDGRIKLKEGWGLDQESIFNSSLSNAFLYILLAARSLGLGTQYVTLTTLPHAQTEIRRILGLPEYLEIYDTVALGYPAYEPRPKYVRALDEVTHYEQFDASKSLSDEEIIERARTREDMRPIQDRTRL